MIRVTSDRWYLFGDWTKQHGAALEAALRKLQIPSHATITLDTSELKHMDTAGAYLLNRLLHTLDEAQCTYTLTELPTTFNELLEIVRAHNVSSRVCFLKLKMGFLERVGRATVASIQKIPVALSFIGEVCVLLVRAIRSPSRIYWRELFYVLYDSGCRALPIVGLLSFLIGIVLAYQMGLQLRTYGANIFIVDFIGLAILREFGPLITAIILAGRTGSAFTAALGTMKMNQEIDALKTMGIQPMDLLVLPKLLGMCIALPLLAVWSDIFGVLGGMVMANDMLKIHFSEFLTQFQHTISFDTYFIGLQKTPAFALLITLIGCHQGFQVSLNADSIGRQTTKSVVQIIFCIIVTDAIYSVYFSWKGI